jgi:hypothetical protein
MTEETYTQKKKIPMTFKNVRVWIMFILLAVMGFIGLGVGYIVSPNFKPPIIIVKPNTSDILIAISSTPGVDSWTLEFNTGIGERNKYDLRVSKEDISIYFHDRNLSDFYNDLYSIKDIK